MNREFVSNDIARDLLKIAKSVTAVYDDEGYNPEAALDELHKKKLKGWEFYFDNGRDRARSGYSYAEGFNDNHKSYMITAQPHWDGEKVHLLLQELNKPWDIGWSSSKKVLNKRVRLGKQSLSSVVEKFISDAERYLKKQR
jgi:hypothetical protein